jgi:hypothetical protein
MSVALYDATVRSYLQILPSVAGLIDIAEAHCREKGQPDEALTGARLADDMWPFAKQVFETGHHSVRAIEGLRSGVFRPEIDDVPREFATLKAEVARSVELLKAVEPAEVEGFADKPLRFEIPGGHHMDFVGSDFLLSFSMPNFYFHATAAYGVLRSLGLPVGKRNFLGALRLKEPS